MYYRSAFCCLFSSLLMLIANFLSAEIASATIQPKTNLQNANNGVTITTPNNQISIQHQPVNPSISSSPGQYDINNNRSTLITGKNGVQYSHDSTENVLVQVGRNGVTVTDTGGRITTQGNTTGALTHQSTKSFSTTISRNGITNNTVNSSASTNTGNNQVTRNDGTVTVNNGAGNGTAIITSSGGSADDTSGGSVFSGSSVAGPAEPVNSYSFTPTPTNAQPFVSGVCFVNNTVTNCGGSATNDGTSNN